MQMREIYLRQKVWHKILVKQPNKKAKYFLVEF